MLNIGKCGKLISKIWRHGMYKKLHKILKPYISLGCESTEICHLFSSFTIFLRQAKKTYPYQSLPPSHTHTKSSKTLFISTFQSCDLSTFWHVWRLCLKCKHFQISHQLLSADQLKTRIPVKFFFVCVCTRSLMWRNVINAHSFGVDDVC